MRIIRKRLSPTLRIATGILLVLAVGSNAVIACSWDYPIWQIRSKTADPYYRFIRNGKAGYINQTGQVIVRPTLKYFGNTDGEFHGGLLDPDSSDLGYIDINGKEIVPKDYWVVEGFRGGSALIRNVDSRAWFQVDRSGRISTAAGLANLLNFDSGSFSEELISISANKEFGYADRTGKIVIEPRFDRAGDFREGRAIVIVDGPCVYYDHGACGGLEYVGNPDDARSDCKFQFIDIEGKLAPGTYFGAKDYSEGLAPVQVSDKWGFIDKSGRLVIEAQFDEAEPFSDGLALVRQDELWGYVNKSGDIVIRPQFEFAEGFVDGIAPVGRWVDFIQGLEDHYYINREGKPAFPEHFELASQFFQGLAHVRLRSLKSRNDDRYDENKTVTHAYINTSGKRIFTYRYRDVDDD